MFDSQSKKKSRKRRMVKNISKKDMDVYLEYYECINKYFDVNGKNTTLHITTPAPTTAAVTNDTLTTSYLSKVSETTTSSTPFNNKTIWMIGAPSVAALLLCTLAICCLGLSKRSEKRKRKLTEAENRAMATTLTSITDTEDGTMYAQCIDQPMYGTELQLPSRKQRNRLGGVSNGIQTMRRWFSVEGDNRTDNSNVIQPYAVRQLPLPAIPESNSKSNSFPRQRGNIEKTLSIRENVYDEIGPDVLRRSNVYNPLLMVKPLGQHGEEAYDSIRSNTLPLRGSSRRVQTGTVDDYFVLEPTIKERNSVNEVPSDNYFIVEKENKQDNENTIGPANGPITNTSLRDRCRKHSGENVGDPEERQHLLGSDSSEGTNSNTNDTEKRSEGTKPTNANETEKETSNYFVLEKVVNQGNNHPDDYLEPIEKHRHSYIDVLPEHDNFMKMKEQHSKSKQSQDTRL